MRFCIIIDASPEEVWEVFFDFDKMSSWSNSLHKITGDIRVGGKVVVDFVGPNGKVGPYKHTLKEFEPGRKIGWSDPIAPLAIDNHLYSLEDAPGGKTKLVQTDEVSGFMALLLGSFLANFMLKSYTVFNQALKEQVEAKS